MGSCNVHKMQYGIHEQSFASNIQSLCTGSTIVGFSRQNVYIVHYKNMLYSAKR